MVIAKGGTLKDVSIGVTPAASPVDALAVAAGREAVSAQEAAEATEEKAGAAAEQQKEAEEKEKAEVRRPLRAVWVGYTAWWDAAIVLGVRWPLCLSNGLVCEQPAQSACRGLSSLLRVRLPLSFVPRVVSSRCRNGVQGNACAEDVKFACTGKIMFVILRRRWRG